MSKAIIVDWKYLKTVLLLPYSRQHWRRLSLEGKAPPALSLGDHRVGWRLSEVIDWLESRPEA
jgi:predicted DNA-binding transcriptional regulator AlpA